MVIKIYKQDLKDNLNSFLRSCGYMPFFESYIRILSGAGYPRFHLYINENDKQYLLNLHIDQKRPSYGKETAHSGEYEGKVVEDEADRIVDLI